MRNLICALQFLTRLPLPATAASPDALARAAPWFPLAGLVVGGVVTALLSLGSRIDPWLGALLALLGWVWITGGLHLDGLADLADGLGAAHGDPARLLAVMREPHVGGYAVICVCLLLLAKLVLLMLVAKLGVSLWLLVLVPVWARLGPLVWMTFLPALGPGLGQVCAACSHRIAILAWGLALLALAFWQASLLLAAPLVLLFWWGFLRARVGGMNGDCLGAGIEVSEAVLLGLLMLQAV